MSFTALSSAPQQLRRFQKNWMPAVHDALAAFRDLPTDVRAFMIVTGIRDRNGLVFEVGAVPDLMPSDGLERISEIVEKAQAAVKGSLH